MEEEKYFGSVRFYKNMILLFFIIAIIIPSYFAAHYKHQLGILQREIVDISAQLNGLQDLASAATDGNNTGANFEVNAETVDYRTLYPDFYAPQPYSAVTREENVIYLTFDDGPSRRTDDVLRILEEKNVKATFFVVGQTKSENIERLKKISERGHTVAMHSYSHDYKKIYASVESFLDDMYQIFCQIRDVTGVTPTYFRFPGGSINAYNTGIYQELFAEMIRRGFVPCDWNISSQDASASGISTAAVINNVVTGSRNKVRGVVLMHDSSSHYTSVEALPRIIDQLTEAGYTFDCLTPNVQPVIFSYRYSKD